MAQRGTTAATGGAKVAAARAGKNTGTTQHWWHNLPIDYAYDSNTKKAFDAFYVDKETNLLNKMGQEINPHWASGYRQGVQGKDYLSTRDLTQGWLKGDASGHFDQLIAEARRQSKSSGDEFERLDKQIEATSLESSKYKSESRMMDYESKRQKDIQKKMASSGVGGMVGRGKRGGRASELFGV